MYGSLLDWFNASITKDRHKRNVDHLYFFMHQVMAGLIPSTCFPDFDLPGDIYFSIVNQHNENMTKWYNEVTNEDTMDPDNYNYWTHLLFKNFTINLNSTQSAETETSGKDSSDGDEGMDIADVRENKSPAITLNSPQSAEKESAEKKSLDDNAGMEVDGVKRV